jgi:hypothetical protein
MAANIYLKLEGVTGEPKGKTHTQEIHLRLLGNSRWACFSVPCNLGSLGTRSAYTLPAPQPRESGRNLREVTAYEPAGRLYLLRLA